MLYLLHLFFFIDSSSINGSCHVYSFLAATNGHSECLRLLIGNADLQSAVDIQDGNGQ